MVAGARRARPTVDGGDAASGRDGSRRGDRDEPRRRHASRVRFERARLLPRQRRRLAVRAVRDAGRARRFLVVDLDVHQGDGTHALCATDPETFTLSINGFRNYPFKRVPGDLELDLPDGTGDDAYLAGLERLLPEAIGRGRPELVFYLAGADPFEGDTLGRLALTKRGLRERDELVRDTFRASGTPVCVTLAGGYAEDIADTVAINVQTAEVFAAPPPRSPLR